MKHLVFLFVTLFSVSPLFSQKVFKLGTVKGKHVTYEVREKKNVPWRWIVRNAHNPDTVLKVIPNPGVSFSQIDDIQMQVAEILLDHLSEEEVANLKKRIFQWFDVVLRVDQDKHKLLQVSCFVFYNKDADRTNRIPEELSVKISNEEFWLNFDPDRLHEIERDIVKRVVLPEKMPEMLLTDDIYISIVPNHDLTDVKSLQEKRKEAIARWKRENPKPQKGFPPMIL